MESKEPITAEDQIQAAHQNMIDSILTAFLNRAPIAEDYQNTKIETGETPDKLKQFYNVWYLIGEEFHLLGTVNIDECNFTQPISEVNTFVLNFVPVMEGMKPLQVKLEI